jgi:DNA-binding LytR/AlgR family response regulator
MVTTLTKKTGNIILIPNRKVLKIINQKSVMYVRAEGNYSVFVMEDQTELTVCKTLEFIEKSLGNSAFFRCHKSYLVNLTKIREIARGRPELLLKNNIRLPIARRKRKEFIKSLYRIEES